MSNLATTVTDLLSVGPSRATPAQSYRAETDRWLGAVFYELNGRIALSAQRMR